jgi:RNA 3'-terminal phosphate cyclase (ATP)
MLELDGAGGGGQLVRTALTLSVLDGRPFRMENVRSDRPNPGLKRQHLACVELLATLTDADVSGAAVGSETLEFEPGAVDDVGTESVQTDVVDGSVDIGTAGSVTLVADTLLPLAARLDAPVRVRLVGGTDVKWSPPTDYLRYVKLPLLRECGLRASVEVKRRGFYPAGGGELLVDVRPSTLSSVVLPARDDRSNANWTVRAVAAAALEDADVAGRMAERAVAALSERGIDEDATATTTYVESASPGAVVTIVAESGVDGDEIGRNDSDDFGGNDGDNRWESDRHERGSRRPARLHPRAGFAAYGERGVPSEDVAVEAVEAADRWRETDAPIDPHLGDQLVVWLAVAGGRVRVPEVTDHVRATVDLVRAFGYDVSIDRRPDDERPGTTLSGAST